MPSLPTLRRELITSLVLVFLGALLVGTTGALLILPHLGSALLGTLYIAALLAADVAVFLIFGRYLLHRRVLAPIERMIAGVESIAGGGYTLLAPRPGTAEMARLAEATNQMAERLITHQEALAANVRSLEETNKELTLARDAMIRAEKMASVGRLAAGIAHEVGNPLGAILGYLGLIGRHVDEQRAELLRSAESEARRIDRIVRGLLDYARVRESHAHPMDVNHVAQQAVELISTQGRFAGIDVRLELAPDLPPVSGDMYQLQQVLVNLLVNASDALAETRDAVLTIQSSCHVHEAVPHVPARRKDDPPGIDYSHRRRLFAAGKLPREDLFAPGTLVVEMEVIDNGPGIPAELLDQIFEPFVTTKDPGSGTGLGLAVCARLVEGMGGIIRAANGRERGAIFHLALPGLVEQPAPAPDAQPEPAADRRGVVA
jgi:signal transduction histidine kinase